MIARPYLVPLVLVLLSVRPAWSQPVDVSQELLEYGVWLDFNNGFRNLDIYAIAADPERPNRLYAGGQGYLYRTLNGGVSWDTIFTLRSTGRQAESGVGERTYSVSTVDDLSDEQVDQVNDLFEQLEEEQYQRYLQEYGEYLATIIVDDMEEDLLEQALQEVLVQQETVRRQTSIDVATESAMPDNTFTQIAIDPRSPARLFAASGRGLFRSLDYGQNWERIFGGAGRSEAQITAIAFGPDDVVVIGSMSGAYRSENGGDNFSRVLGPPSNASIAFVAASPAHPQYLYLVADGRVYRSRDAGMSWLPLAVPPSTPDVGNGNLAVDPENSNHVLLGTPSGVQETLGGGDTFNLLGSVGLRDRRVLWTAFYSSAILASTADGIFASLDSGNTWQDLNEQLRASVIRQIAFSPDQHVWIATNAGVFQLMHPLEMVSGQELARQAMALWAGEPDLGQTLTASLTYYGYSTLAVDGWANRLRWCQLLPDVRVEYRVYQERNEISDYVYPVDANPYREGEDLRRQDDQEFLAMALWDVERIVMDVREMSILQAGERLIRRRNALVRRLVRLYNSRRELMMNIAEGSRTTPARLLMSQMELAEMTARLDAMTGGFFSAFSRIAQ